FFFFQAEDGIRDFHVTGVQTCALPILFSLAAIERMGLKVDYEHLPMMISAPAQGVVAICGRADDLETKELFRDVDHRETRICVRSVERRVGRKSERELSLRNRFA